MARDEMRVIKFPYRGMCFLINSDGTAIGRVPVDYALSKSQEQSLDLVEINAMANPPVFKIMDYGKYKFKAAKTEHAAKAKQSIQKMKEIKLYPKTSSHDYSYRMEQAKEFLQKGFKVRVVVEYRGREMANLGYGRHHLDSMKTDLAESGQIEQDIKMLERNMSIIFAPKK